MFNKSDIERDNFQLYRKQARNGYDWWWHSFTGYNEKTNQEKSFFIEFFICNPKYKKDEPILGQLPLNKKQGNKPSYLMIKAGCWGEDACQIHRFFGLNKVNIKKDSPFEVSCENCLVSENKIIGNVQLDKKKAKDHPELMSDGGSIEFNLKIDKNIAYNVGYGANKLMRKLQLFEMFWHAEGMKSFYDGYVIFNGEKYIVKPENCYGYADKNWGKNFTSPWVWLSSNDLVSLKTGERLNNSVFDIGGGRPKIGFVPLKRKLLSALYLEGKEYEFNFSKFWTFTKTKFDCKETDSAIIWHVEQKSKDYKMITDVVCQKKDMILVNYESPDGNKRHNKLWNGGNGIGTVKLFYKENMLEELEAKHVGCEYGEY